MIVYRLEIALSKEGHKSRLSSCSLQSLLIRRRLFLKDHIQLDAATTYADLPPYLPAVYPIFQPLIASLGSASEARRLISPRSGFLSIP